ncbi:T9SS type A sorting domain-containing protein [Fulvivirga sp. M361]|uniref:T9SS type A sorting domain-containing protein n=1 Tax=Fulvivirga sp. M361 TaxID=2594266 RepID=UPI00117B47C9|nr:T9SS type A sorting domain-containing protein [Fulvivirga sp. M361]TRX58867.1 T9SS type A sorting domain-containing protein [Fulvivirga sp. M361]
MMKRVELVLIAMCLLTFTDIMGQAQNTIISMGSEMAGTGGAVSYSIGQLITTDYSSEKGSLNHGIQQPFILTVVAGIENETIQLDLEVSAFPNPTIDFLTIKAKNLSGKTEAMLFDINGRLLKNRLIKHQETLINMTGMVDAVYLLKILDDSGHLKTFRIVKNENK